MSRGKTEQGKMIESDGGGITEQVKWGQILDLIKETRVAKYLGESATREETALQRPEAGTCFDLFPGGAGSPMYQE